MFTGRSVRADISQVGGLIQRHIEGARYSLRILRASSLESNLAAERPPRLILEMDIGEPRRVPKEIVNPNS